MTGYGRATAMAGGRTVTAEIRTVNHRYLDMRIRVPDGCHFLEDRVRRFISERLARGRIEVSLVLEQNSQSGLTLTVDEQLLQQARVALERARGAIASTEPVTLSHLLHIPQLWRIEPEPLDEESVTHAACAAIVLALDDVVSMRRAEGEALAVDIRKRVEKVASLRTAVAKEVPGIVKEAQRRLQQRVQSLLDDISLEPDRIAQEVALLADRTDVSEELARIDSHLEMFRTHLKRGGTVGRTLDFLLQELNREWNTIASKSNDAFVAHMVVEARAELEKIREQVQNIQ